MADTSIEWTDAVWNPVRGCQIVSPGCHNCYAMKFAHRFSGPGRPYEGLTKLGPHGPVWSGKVTLHPERLNDPFKWRKPRRVFVNSMSDLFHEDVSVDFVNRVFQMINICSQHTFQILTKRPCRMLDYLYYMEQECEFGVPANAWLGVSVEDQQRADQRIPYLLKTSAAVRWLSLEPLLGPVDLHHVHKPHRGESPAIAWAVIGGESGPGARPCHVEWIRDLMQQCRAAGVAVFVKQLGSRPTLAGQPLKLRDSKGGRMDEWPEDLRVREFPGWDA